MTEDVLLLSFNLEVMMVFADNVTVFNVGVQNKSAANTPLEEIVMAGAGAMLLVLTAAMRLFGMSVSDILVIYNNVCIATTGVASRACIPVCSASYSIDYWTTISGVLSQI